MCMVYIVFFVYIYSTFFLKKFFFSVQVSLKKVIFVYRNVAKRLEQIDF